LKNSNLPEVSIVMPVFNQLEYTVQAINSVIKNTQGVTYELIVINNGSTDGTTDYLNGLKKKIANVKVFHFSENKGFLVYRFKVNSKPYNSKIRDSS